MINTCGSGLRHTLGASPVPTPTWPVPPSKVVPLAEAQVPAGSASPSNCRAMVVWSK